MRITLNLSRLVRSSHSNYYNKNNSATKFGFWVLQRPLPGELTVFVKKEPDLKRVKAPERLEKHKLGSD